jgi:hypothetical protein
MKPNKATPGMVCVPHRERTGVEVNADVVTGGTAMCKSCFRGIPLSVDPRILTRNPVAARSHGAKACAPMRTVAHVLPGNPSKHRLLKGLRAMAVARVYPEHGIGGTGNRDKGLMRSIGKFGPTHLRIARAVLRYSPELADQVSMGKIPLTRAHQIVKAQKKPDGPNGAPYTHVKGTKAQKAMALAMRFPGGGWGTDREARKYLETGGFCYARLKLSRRVLRHSRELAESVLRGQTPLNVAVKLARCRSRAVTRGNATKPGIERAVSMDGAVRSAGVTRAERNISGTV